MAGYGKNDTPADDPAPGAYGRRDVAIDEINDPGFLSTIKRTGGQMLTTGATSIEDLTGPNRVTQAVRDTGQGIIDRNPAGIQSLGDIASSPWLTVKEAVGQFVPQVGAAAAGAAGGAAIGRRIAGAPGAAVGAGIGSLAPIFSQEYGGIREDQKEGGQEDKGRALAAATAATALERVAMPIKFAGGLRAAGKSIPGEIAKGFAKEGATEAAQTAIEQVGAFKDPTTKDSMEEQALAGIMGGIGGGVLGGAHAGAQKLLGGGETKPAPGETKPAAAGTPGAESATEPAQSVTPAAPAATPEAVRAQKLPETGGPLTGAVNAGIEAQAQGLEAAAGKAPLSEDEMLAAQFHVEQRRQDGTPAGAQFAAAYDAGRISPREALEAFRLSQSPEFTLPQPGVDANELTLEQAAALAARGGPLTQAAIPAGESIDMPVETVEPAAPPVLPGEEGAPAASPTSVAAAPTAQPAVDAVSAAPAVAAAPATAPRTLRDVQAQRAAARAAQQQQEPASGQPPLAQPAAAQPAVAEQPAPPAAAPAPAAAVAQPAEVAPTAAPAPPKPSEKWHYRSTDAGTPLREMPADRMKDAREVDGLVPGLRFLVHRDVDAGKTWSVTERTTGNTLTTGHSSAELAEFAAIQRVQQVGADRVQARVREMLQQGGLSEDEALNVTAEPRKGKVPGLNDVIAAYKRAAGGELDANMNATAVAFHRALADQNVKTIRDLAHPDNPKSQAVIEALSGKKLARGAMQSANIAEGWLRSLHQKPVTPQVPAPAPNAAAPVSTQAPAPAAGATATAAPATTPRRGEIGMKLAGGEVVLTSSGRKTTPFPKVSLGSNGQAAKTVAAADRWLLDNAAAEARARGDDFNAPTFEADAKLKSIPPASKDAAEEYLFGTQPAVRPPFLKPLAPAAAAPAISIDPVKRRAVLQALRDCLAA